MKLTQKYINNIKDDLGFKFSQLHFKFNIYIYY